MLETRYHLTAQKQWERYNTLPIIKFFIKQFNIDVYTARVFVEALGNDLQSSNHFQLTLSFPSLTEAELKVAELQSLGFSTSIEPILCSSNLY